MQTAPQHLMSAGRVAALVLVMGLAGCSSGGSGQSRPLVGASAAEGAAVDGGVSGELDFFDALAGRKLVCHDDVLHAALYVGNGVSGVNYGERVVLARRLGYVDAGFDRPAREAATMGEVARVMLRISDGAAAAAGVTQEQAIARMSGRGVLPGTVKPYQGLTGAQLVTVMGSASEAMGERSRPRITVADLTPQTPPTVKVPDPVGPRATTAIASADEGNGSGTAKGEPLPAAATDPAIEKPMKKDVVVQSAAPIAPAPVQAAPVEREPVAAKPVEPVAPPAPEKPRVWVPGKPLKKSAN